MVSLSLHKPLRVARAYPREAAIAAAVLIFSAAAMASVVTSPTHLDRRATNPIAAAVAPLSVPDMTVQAVAPEKAVEINREIPVTAAAGPAAAPFALIGANASARTSALTCLSQAIYYEAGNESEEGQRSVAQVVLNRVRHPAFPASVCGVVYQGSTRATGCQFTFTCDGSLDRRPDLAGWDRARGVADAALNGSVAGSVGYATHYHANYVLPTWAHTLAKTDVIGAHLFYRWAGGWGQPGTFIQRYGGHEASADALRSQARAARATFVAAEMLTAGHPLLPAAAAAATGLPVTQQTNDRVSPHFTPRARAAVEAAFNKPPAASDTAAVSRALEAGAPSTEQKPLGS